MNYFYESVALNRVRELHDIYTESFSGIAESPGIQRHF